jgi:indole-3-glycerol phosphate synthase
MRERIPDDCLLVGESGIRTPEDVRRLADAGVDAILVGESLMAQPDIRVAVRTLLSLVSAS